MMKFRTFIALFVCLFLDLAVGMAQTDSAVLRRQQAENDSYQQMLSSEMDKMLHLWYVRKEVENSKSVLSKVEDDTLSLTQENDSIISERLKRISTVVPIRYEERVKRMVNLYLNRKRSSSALLGLAQYYYPWMKEIFDRYDVPEEIVYITIIESSLNPVAVSRAGATGIWQFMYTTGKMYGLNVNTFVDDRRDPVKATEAAARHFKDLYAMFNDWGLAIAAYNCGPGNVRKAIQRSGGKTTFWEVVRFLPKETQNYFPAFIGAFYMMTYHNAYGIKPAHIAIPTAVDTIMVNHELHLKQVAEVLNIDLQELRTLNPQYKRDVVPAFSDPYPLKLRNQDVLRFMELQDSIYHYNYDQYFAPLQSYVNVFTGKNATKDGVKKKYHTVKSGETLSKIANKYGLSVEELKKMNGLKSNYINPKKRLVVGYEYAPSTQPAATQPTDSLTSAKDTLSAGKPAPTTPAQPAKTEVPDEYVVKKGESLYGIATRFHVAPRRLAEYNNIKNMNDLKVGQKLKIPKN